MGLTDPDHLRRISKSPQEGNDKNIFANQLIPGDPNIIIQQPPAIQFIETPLRMANKKNQGKEKDEKQKRANLPEIISNRSSVTLNNVNSKMSVQSKLNIQQQNSQSNRNQNNLFTKNYYRNRINNAGEDNAGKGDKLLDKINNDNQEPVASKSMEKSKLQGANKTSDGMFSTANQSNVRNACVEILDSLNDTKGMRYSRQKSQSRIIQRSTTLTASNKSVAGNKKLQIIQQNLHSGNVAGGPSHQGGSATVTRHYGGLYPKGVGGLLPPKSSGTAPPNRQDSRASDNKNMRIGASQNRQPIINLGKQNQLVSIDEYKNQQGDSFGTGVKITPRIGSQVINGDKKKTIVDPAKRKSMSRGTFRAGQNLDANNNRDKIGSSYRHTSVTVDRKLSDNQSNSANQEPMDSQNAATGGSTNYQRTKSQTSAIKDSEYTGVESGQIQQSEDAKKTSKIGKIARLAQQERNQKYLEELQKKRQAKFSQQDLKKKKEEEQRIKIREQVAKKNAKLIEQRVKEKQQEEEERKKVEEEKKDQVQVITGPSQDFLERQQKSNKQKQPPITDWKVFRKKNNLDENTKIFICSNAYPSLIQEMERRGWFRNKDRKSGIFHLKNVILERESSMMEDLKPFQLVNHFLRNNLVTTKTGLQNSLKNLVWWSTVAQDTFFPRCFDLTANKEMDDFVAEFRVVRAESILKRYVKKKEFPSVEKLLIVIHINEKRLKDVDEQIDDPDLENLVTDEEFDFIEKDKFSSPDHLQDLLDKKWYQKIQLKYQHLCQGDLIDSKDVESEGTIDEESNEDEDEGEGEGEGEADGNQVNDEELQEGLDAQGPDNQQQSDEKVKEQQNEEVKKQETPAQEKQEEQKFVQIENKKGQYQALYKYCQDLCTKLREKFTQFNMNGTENLWLLKPGSSSRGRGIKIYKSHQKLINRINKLKGNVRLWVAQKCIENPLIVENRKFDIRQWVLVTDWNPLTIWCFRNSYIRFSMVDYDPKSESRKNHLCNNSVTSKYAEYNESEIEGNMWSSDDFADHLEDRYGEDVFEESIWPQIKKVVKASLQSVQDMVDNRKNSFEFFGYDFMVDTDLRLWLIEINSSPSMDMGTAVTHELVHQVLTDLPKVIIDYPNARNKNKCDTGGFECIYRSKIEVQRPQAVNLNNIFCEGKKMTIKKPKTKKVKPKEQPYKDVKSTLGPLMRSQQSPTDQQVPRRNESPIKQSGSGYKEMTYSPTKSQQTINSAYRDSLSPVNEGDKVNSPVRSMQNLKYIHNFPNFEAIDRIQQMAQRKISDLYQNDQLLD